MMEIIAYEMQFSSKTVHLLWSIKHIRNNNDEPIILHVAKWNEKALKLYLDNGFEISKIEKVR